MKESTLKDLTLNITDGKHGDCEGQDNSGYYFISCKDVHDGQIYYEGARQITEKDYIDTHKRTQLEPNDILITNSGTIGRMTFIKETPLVYRTTFQKSVAIVKPNPDLIYPLYLYYQLQNCVAQFINSSNGSAQKNLLLSTMRAFKIKYHSDFSIQHRIASILSAYDDLIENNQKQIKLLEEAAQRLYKEWFVDLRFPNYENTPVVDGVPEGWRYIPLENVISYEIGGGWGEENVTEKFEKPAYVIRGTDFYGITHGNISDIPYRYHTESNLSSRELSDGDIIFEVSGGSKTEGVARTVLIREALLESYNQPVMCASFCKLIRLVDKNLSQFMYDTFLYLRLSGKTSEFDKKSASSIVNYRWKDFLSQQFILIPSQEMLKKYNSLAEHYYNLIICNSKQIEKLKNARDRLLPKLMSGELEV